MAFPNNITTATAIFNAILTKLLSLEAMTSATGFICAKTRWLGEAYPGDRYVEVIPGASKELSVENAVGRRKHQFTIAVFWRLLVDMTDQDTERLANASAGLLQFIDIVDSAIANSALKGLANVPIKPDMTQEAEDDPLDVGGGWVMQKRIYDVTYLWAYPDVQDLS